LDNKVTDIVDARL